MLKIIGSNHLDSKEKIEGIIKDFSPDVLGVELCEFRAENILKEEMQVNSEDKSLLGKIMNKIKTKAEEKSLDFGSDMKTVLKYSKENNLPLVLVDMPIIKIQELFMKIPQNEQIGFQKELNEFEAKGLIDKEVDENEVLLNLRTHFPIAFEFLINMRNLYIANQILKAEKKYQNKRILIFLGKAHVKQVEIMI